MARLKIFQKAEAPFGINRGKLSYKGWINKSYSIAQGTIFNTLWQTTMEKNMGGGEEKWTHACKSAKKEI